MTHGSSGREGGNQGARDWDELYGGVRAPRLGGGDRKPGDGSAPVGPLAVVYRVPPFQPRRAW